MKENLFQPKSRTSNFQIYAGITNSNVLNAVSQNSMLNYQLKEKIKKDSRQLKQTSNDTLDEESLNKIALKINDKKYSSFIKRDSQSIDDQNELKKCESVQDINIKKQHSLTRNASGYSSSNPYEKSDSMQRQLMKFKSVKDILFSHGQSSSKIKENAHKSQLKQYFQKMKKYGKLRRQVRAFLHDEIGDLNQEFLELQKLNFYLQDQNDKLKAINALKSGFNSQNLKSLDTQKIKALNLIFDKIERINKSNIRSFFTTIKKLQSFNKLMSKIFNRQRLKKLFRTYNQMKINSMFIKMQQKFQHKIDSFSKEKIILKTSDTTRNCNQTNNHTTISQNHSSISNFQNDQENRVSFLQKSISPMRDISKESVDKQNFKNEKIQGKDEKNKQKAIKNVFQKEQEKYMQSQNIKQFANLKNSQNQQKRFFDEKLLQKIQRLKELDKEGFQKAQKCSNQITQQIQADANLKKSIDPKEAKNYYNSNISQYMRKECQQQTTINSFSQSGILHSQGETIFIQQLEQVSDISIARPTSKQNLSITDNILESFIFRPSFSEQDLSQNQKQQPPQTIKNKKKRQQPSDVNDYILTPNFNQDGDQKKNKPRIQTDQEENMKILQKRTLFEVNNNFQAQKAFTSKLNIKGIISPKNEKNKGINFYDQIEESNTDDQSSYLIQQVIKKEKNSKLAKTKKHLHFSKKISKDDKENIDANGHLKKLKLKNNH